MVSQSIRQWYSTFLTLQLFNTVPHVTEMSHPQNYLRCYFLTKILLLWIAIWIFLEIEVCQEDMTHTVENHWLKKNQCYLKLKHQNRTRQITNDQAGGTMRGSPELEVESLGNVWVGVWVGMYVKLFLRWIFFNTMRTIPENEINLKRNLCRLESIKIPGVKMIWKGSTPFIL